MSTTGRPDANAPAASDVAARLADAEFVRLVAAADGDAVAATGLFARTLDARDTPYQATVAPLPERADRATDADLTVSIGRAAATADLTLGVETVASATAFEAASEIGSPDPLLALAGIVAAGEVPSGTPLEAAQAMGLERRPGVAIPTADLVDGLAHSTLVAAPFSGSEDATADLLAEFDTDQRDEETRRRIASLVALAVAGDEHGTEQGTRAVERMLRPYVGGPFETIGGYADVLDAVARERPGLAVALAVGSLDTETALDSWRTHGKRAHAALSTARTGRYDGLFVVRCDDPAPVGTVARLARDFRSPEPVVLVVADDEAAALGPAEAAIGDAMETAIQTVDGEAAGTPTRGRARFAADETEFVLAFREAQ
ncbi:hypothetical protein [Salinibaculum rarum]|uniref:hypothetical protein n=1 Tax=Salinibaculum rarum TaxID=3058903 RepID=UPI00265F0ED7|nr:hypothetical protein [Salinibaculum sp. KK48]